MSAQFEHKESEKEAEASGIASLIPEIYYDLIARVPAGSLILVIGAYIVGWPDLNLQKLEDLSERAAPAALVIVVLFILGIGGLIGILISPIATWFRHLYWKSPWETDESKNILRKFKDYVPAPSLLTGEPIDTKIIALVAKRDDLKPDEAALLLKLMKNALEAKRGELSREEKALLIKHLKADRKADGSAIHEDWTNRKLEMLDRWFYDYVQDRSQVGRGIMPKLRAEADLGNYLAAAVTVLLFIHFLTWAYDYGWHRNIVVWQFGREKGVFWFLMAVGSIIFSVLVGSYRTERLVIRMLAMASIIHLRQPLPAAGVSSQDVETYIEVRRALQPSVKQAVEQKGKGLSLTTFSSLEDLIMGSDTLREQVRDELESQPSP